mmetsp:Transcript_25319/g.70805  ORF Transcript_25319/g.70805 Transcript_25319/m.70805 type:complete len:332 (+) Transcript_25319:777-1772(+)
MGSTSAPSNPTQVTSAAPPADAAPASAPAPMSGTAGLSVPSEYAGLSAKQIEFMERRRAEQGLLPLVNGSTATPTSSASVDSPTVPVSTEPSSATEFLHAPLSYFALDKLTPKGRRKNVDRGEPHDFTRSLVKGATSVGSWACTEGGWDSPSERPTTEWFIVLSGSGCVTDPDGTRHPFGPGDLVILPKGWHGRWDITEAIHKVWVVRDHPDIPGASTTPVVVPVSQLEAASGASTVRKGAVHGFPFTTGSEMYSLGDVSAGYWCCTPGSFPCKKSATEAFHVREGVFFLTNADGSARRCVAGDTIVLPKGWSGHWDVIETVKKVWVVISE